jgi:hypothetical protein
MAKLISFPRPGKETVVWVNPDTVRAVLQKGGAPDQAFLYFNGLTDKECLLVQGDAATVAARLNGVEG